MKEKSIDYKNKNDDLILRIRNNDEHAKTEFIQFNEGLIRSIVNNYPHASMEYDDLFQIGCIALINSLDNYDFSYECSFSTYVTPIINNAIIDALLNNDILLPYNAIKKINKLKKVEDKLKAKSPNDPTIENLAEEMDTTSEAVKNIIELREMRPTSLEKITEEKNLQLSDKNIPSPENEVIDTLSRKDLINVVSKLKPDYKKVIEIRYLSGKVRTLSETAKILNCSMENVRQKEKKALKKLKQISMSLKLSCEDLLPDDNDFSL